MLDDLVDPNAEKREQALEEIEAAASADRDDLARLFVELTASARPNELGSSYRALALSILIRIDAAGHRVLRLDGDSHRRLQPLLEWWSSKRDGSEPAWREDCGWLDSIGHGAELAGAVGQHPTTSAATVTDVASRTARLARADGRFDASEGERLALAFALLSARGPQVLDQLDPHELWETASATTPVEPGWQSNLNLRAFLGALATIWTFGVEVPEGGIDLPPRDLGSPECTWLRRALATTDTSGLWSLP